MNRSNDFFTIIAATLVISVMSFVVAVIVDFSVRRVVASKKQKARSEEIMLPTADTVSSWLRTSDSSSILILHDAAPFLILRASDGDEWQFGGEGYLFSVDTLRGVLQDSLVVSGEFSPTYSGGVRPR